ncbi:MAG TPA: hypothetical protein VMT30_03375 [Candidatus Saccharimonadia bacterium]|nr:hypothetical protein [Candidatus Saccharimonadia bacterium]
MRLLRGRHRRAKALIVFLLVAASFFVDVTALRAALPTQPTLRLYPTTSAEASAHSRLLIFQTGYQSNATALTVNLLPYWRLFGDVLLVEYPHWRFDSARIVSDLNAYLEHSLSRRGPPRYTRLTLMGASLGGLLADDEIRGLNHLAGITRRDLVLVDAPTGGADIISGPQRKAAHVPLGPVFGTVPFWPINQLVFRPPPALQLGPAASQVQLDALHRQARLYQPSALADQAGYIVHHAPLRPNPARNGVQAIYLRSTHRDTVAATAYDHWRRIYPHLQLVPVTSGHIDLLGYPNAWMIAFTQALSQLG